MTRTNRAARAPQPLSIGIGFRSARLATLFPQPRNILPLAILTEHELQGLEQTS